MYSFNFPEMIRNNNAVLLKDKEAVKCNLNLLFSTERQELFGDPYFGSLLKRVLFEQAHSLVADLVVDEIYTAILTFIPQIYLTRKDIKLFIDKTNLYATISYVYVVDNTSDMYTILLTSGGVV